MVMQFLEFSVYFLAFIVLLAHLVNLNVKDKGE